MAYTEVSVYGYITGDQLEAYHVDYSTINSTLYTEVLVMAHVTQAERWINEYCGCTFTGTIPDGVVAATLTLAKHLMSVRLKEDGYNEDYKTPLQEIEEFCMSALTKRKVTHEYTGTLSSFNLYNNWG